MDTRFLPHTADHVARWYFRRLPHLRVPGATFLVTFRLNGDEVPALGERERTVVMETLRAQDGVRYRLFGAVVLDDRVYAVVGPFAGFAVERIVHTWKATSAHALGRGPRRVWSTESGDLAIRDDRELDDAMRFLAKQPKKRWPSSAEAYAWLYSVAIV